MRADLWKLTERNFGACCLVWNAFLVLPALLLLVPVLLRCRLRDGLACFRLPPESPPYARSSPGRRGNTGGRRLDRSRGVGLGLRGQGRGGRRLDGAQFRAVQGWANVMVMALCLNPHARPHKTNESNKRDRPKLQGLAHGAHAPSTACGQRGDSGRCPALRTTEKLPRPKPVNPEPLPHSLETPKTLEARNAGVWLSLGCWAQRCRVLAFLQV